MTYSCDSLGSGRPKATTGRKGVITMVSTVGHKNCSKSIYQHPNAALLSQRRGSRTILCVGVEGGELRLRLGNHLLPVHALLQALEHALLSDSLDVPSAKGKSESRQKF